MLGPFNISNTGPWKTSSFFQDVSMNFHESNYREIKTIRLKWVKEFPCQNFLRKPAKYITVFIVSLRFFFPGIFLETHGKYLFFSWTKIWNYHEISCEITRKFHGKITNYKKIKEKFSAKLLMELQGIFMEFFWTLNYVNY